MQDNTALVNAPESSTTSLQLSEETVNFPITQATLAGIRRAGRDRGRGQVDGLIWQDVERVCIYAETEGTLIGLRDSAMIRLMSDCLLRISEVVADSCALCESGACRTRCYRTIQRWETISGY